jgi:hypothetical protein
MVKLFPIFLVLVSLAGCYAKGPQNGPPALDPYATARAAVAGAEITLYFADDVFESWAAGQTDLIKVAKARAGYVRIRAAVADGLRVALDTIDVAEKVHAGLNLGQILAQADGAYQDLKAFLNDLFSVPASGPASRAVLAKASKHTPRLVSDLPPTLLPAGIKVKAPEPKPAPVKKSEAKSTKLPPAKSTNKSD